MHVTFPTFNCVKSHLLYFGGWGLISTFPTKTFFVRISHPFIVLETANYALSFISFTSFSSC